MRRMLYLPLATVLLSGLPAPAVAAAGNFTIVNGTEAGLSSLSIRRFGTSEWRPLAAAASPGARAAVQFSDTDCAFDLQANLAGIGTATWAGVNLCEANVLTLRRGASGETWVDYD